MFTRMRAAVDRLRIGSGSSAAAADECAPISPPRYRRPTSFSAPMQTTSLPSRTHARRRGAAPAGGGPGGAGEVVEVDREHGYGLCDPHRYSYD
jgi:hypothetical protein